MLSELYKYIKYFLSKAGFTFKIIIFLLLCCMKKILDSKFEIDRLSYFKSISNLSLDDLNNKSCGWSILQHLYHCFLVESLANQYIAKKILYPETITNVSLLTYFKSFLTPFVWKLGYKAKAPKITATFPNEIDLDKLNLNWIETRKCFEELITKLYDLNLEKKGFFRHPIIGRINLKLTLSFYDFHYNHHKLLIEKIISKI